MADNSRVQRFMRFTGRLRLIFGPAHSSPLDHEMTAENKELLARQQEATAQWTTVTRADGTSYLVPKDPGDRSLR
ncbi:MULTISPECIES: hypothetical protein [unclassified Arthrobacter]|uniref:hypothetical protein n=1 Tax=unclassified Arthrobacter TaxID=235627 RepID=UPI00159D64A9|nr:MULTISPECIES: hypothetical protein [unclassified Arthrobacter]MCQ9162695.1 hypothetical protein [Arthrobacter sp. STN4]NVM97322.1 hypothetical protein [Arthrobacter sp. SDTb3-6]